MESVLTALLKATAQQRQEQYWRAGCAKPHSLHISTPALLCRTWEELLYCHSLQSGVCTPALPCRTALLLGRTVGVSLQLTVDSDDGSQWIYSLWTESLSLRVENLDTDGGLRRQVLGDMILSQSCPTLEMGSISWNVLGSSPFIWCNPIYVPLNNDNFWSQY